MISTLWGCRSVRVRTDSVRSDRMRRIRVRTVRDSKDADDETEGDAEGEAESLSGCVVHVTQATFVLYRGVNPLGRGSNRNEIKAT